MLLQMQVGSGILESVSQVAAAAGAFVLLLMLVALGSFAYKSLSGDGIRWPDETEETEQEDGVSRGGDDDEWEFY
ncbi:hypothetical protein [Haloarcula halophila]|uniref:hypothetical protein n=1 Tax=Haloarcula TaxID=2237 RepID=UPI0023E42AC2|nr:hypothetical protein [Halomicroarcula sp. DFY41]